MTRLTLASLLVLAAGASPVLAESACNHPDDDVGGLQCSTKIYRQADHDLNTGFGRARAKLDDQGRAALTSGKLS